MRNKEKDELSTNLEASFESLKKGELPRHIALIPDGNRRWAKKNLLKAAGGYEFGAKRVVEFIDVLARIGVEYLTIYLFSTENWRRDTAEYSAYFKLVENYLIAQKDKMLSEGVRLHVIGDITPFPQSTKKVIEDCLSATCSNTNFHLVIALNYGGRAEILSACKSLAHKAKSGEISPEQIDEEIFCSHLNTKGLPDPDLLIRTSGEHRISNFLLWQLCYTELYLPQTPWPEFDAKELYTALVWYQQRERRWGK